MPIITFLLLKNRLTSINLAIINSKIILKQSLLSVIYGKTKGEETM